MNACSNPGSANSGHNDRHRGYNPLNHLILIDQASILEALYARVIAPAAVLVFGFRVPIFELRVLLSAHSARKAVMGSACVALRAGM